ncbi:hypothetical protein [Mycobacterium hubeiense]|uniref:hypothetical protein n=1 Tax=Mycobacterium hubeiense TaxID=1867256 RepID=UPI000C7F1CC1|nr:hypothetical protein [Mycobacterium sp. QGD 101]
MTTTSAKELVDLVLKEPARDLGEFAARLVDYITDQAMLVAAESSLNDPSIVLGSMFTQTFDALLRHALEGLDRINPTGAAYLRAGIRALAADALAGEAPSGADRGNLLLKATMTGDWSDPDG